MSEVYDATYAAVRSRISGGNIQEAIQSAFQNSFDGSFITGHIVQAAQIISCEQTRPCVLFRPQLLRKAGQWWAGYGENETGLWTSGETPEKAMEAFDKAWMHQHA